MFAAALPGWLLADIAGDLLAHGEILAGGGAGVARYGSGNGAVLPDACASEHDERHERLHDGANQERSRPIGGVRNHSTNSKTKRCPNTPGHYAIHSHHTTKESIRNDKLTEGGDWDDVGQQEEAAEEEVRHYQRDAKLHWHNGGERLKELNEAKDDRGAKD